MNVSMQRCRCEDCDGEKGRRQMVGRNYPKGSSTERFLKQCLGGVQVSGGAHCGVTGHARNRELRGTSGNESQCFVERASIDLNERQMQEFEPKSKGGVIRTWYSRSISHHRGSHGNGFSILKRIPLYFVVAWSRIRVVDIVPVSSQKNSTWRFLQHQFVGPVRITRRCWKTTQSNISQSAIL